MENKILKKLQTHLMELKNHLQFKLDVKLDLSLNQKKYLMLIWLLWQEMLLRK